MSRRITYFNSSRASLLNPLQIFGGNLYDWWDYTDLSTQSITGGLIDSITSKGTNTDIFTSSGTERPQSIIGINGLNVADFDGINDAMTVPSSTGLFNFIHNGNEGCVILITKKETGGGCDIISNIEGSSQTGFRIQDTALENISAVVGNSSGTLSILNISSNMATQNLFNLSFINFDADASPVNERSEILLNSISTKANVQTASPSVLNATNNLVLGKRAFVNDRWFRGKIAEVLILTIIPSSAQIFQLTNYFTHKYGGNFPRN